MQLAVASFGVGIVLFLGGILLAGLTFAMSRRGSGSFRGIAVATSTVLCVTGLVMCLLPGFFGGVVACMLGVATAIAIYQRNAGERAALDEAIGLAVARGIPLDRLGYAFAHGRHDRLGERAHRFAQYIGAGFAPDQAALTAGLRLTPELRTSLARLNPAESSAERPVARNFEGNLRGNLEGNPAAGTVIGGFYLALLVLFATLAISLLIAPIVMEMFSYMEFEFPPWMAVVDQVISFLPLLCMLLLLTLAVFAGLWWMMHAAILGGGRWLPVLGPYYRSRYDAQALEWLAGGIANGESLDELEQELRRARIGPSGARLGRALKAVREGTDWPQALRRASLVTRSALPWLAVTHGGEHLARALYEAAAARRRHAGERLKMGLRIAGPIGVAIAAVPILLCGLLLIGMLSHIIQELA